MTYLITAPPVGLRTLILRRRALVGILFRVALRLTLRL